MNQKQKLIILLSWTMIVLSAISIVLVFGTAKGAGSRPLVPSLVPILNWKFGFIFLVFQILFCYFFRIRYGILAILVTWAVTVPSIYIGEDFRWSPLALSGVDRIITGSSCGSALVVGVATLKGKLKVRFE